MKENEPTSSLSMKRARCLTGRRNSWTIRRPAASQEGPGMAALEVAGDNVRAGSAFPRWRDTAGGLTTVASHGVAVSLWFGGSRQNLPLRQPDEVEILTAQEHLELYEDLEFFRWLAAEDSRGKGAER